LGLISLQVQPPRTQIRREPGKQGTPDGHAISREFAEGGLGYRLGSGGRARCRAGSALAEY